MSLSRRSFLKFAILLFSLTFNSLNSLTVRNTAPYYVSFRITGKSPLCVNMDSYLKKMLPTVVSSNVPLYFMETYPTINIVVKEPYPHIEVGKIYSLEPYERKTFNVNIGFYDLEVLEPMPAAQNRIEFFTFLLSNKTNMKLIALENGFTGISYELTDKDIR